MAYDINKLVKLGQLKALATKTSAEVEALKTQIPTKVSDLTNDSAFQTSAQVAEAIQTAISASGHAVFQKVDAVPDAETAQSNVLYLVMNEETGHYDIYAKVENEVVLLDDTTVDLTNYVEKEAGKGLSTNDYTTEEKEKLAGLSNYQHPSHTAAESGLYKITVDALGHVTAVEAVTKTDITGLGIPEQDTTYEEATTEAAGLLSAADKTKLNGIAEGATKVEASETAGSVKVNGTDVTVVSIATDTEVTEMLDEVFPAAT